jgi:hypothetical protein
MWTACRGNGSLTPYIPSTLSRSGRFPSFARRRRTRRERLTRHQAGTCSVCNVTRRDGQRMGWWCVLPDRHLAASDTDGSLCVPGRCTVGGATQRPQRRARARSVNRTCTGSRHTGRLWSSLELRARRFSSCSERRERTSAPMQECTGTPLRVRSSSTGLRSHPLRSQAACTGHLRSSTFARVTILLVLLSCPTLDRPSPPSRAESIIPLTIGPDI